MILLAGLALAMIGDPDGLDLAVARALPPQELERRVFQNVRGTTREVAVRDISRYPLRANQRPDFDVEFADAPKPTALPGLCGAQVRTATFGRGYAPYSGENPPSHLIDLQEETRYAVDPAALSKGAGAGGCVAGPVLGNPRYFQVSGMWGRPANPDSVARAVRAISGMMRDGAKKWLSPVACTEDGFASLGGVWEPLCADAAGAIGALRWETLFNLVVRQCDNGALCISAYFQRPVVPSDASHFVILTFEIDGRKDDDVRSVALSGVTRVD